MALPVMFKAGLVERGGEFPLAFREIGESFPLVFVEYAGGSVIVAICDKFLCDEAICGE